MHRRALLILLLPLLGKGPLLGPLLLLRALLLHLRPLHRRPLLILLLPLLGKGPLLGPLLLLPRTVRGGLLFA
ncbi:hypothetical protein LMG26296_05592 [Cupriavidus plantarum]|nr:hypothetical protein LMG26296_05592 [Cupriavidus plantarum]